MSKLTLNQAVQVYGRLGMAASFNRLTEENLRSQARDALVGAHGPKLNAKQLEVAVDDVSRKVPKSWYTGRPKEGIVGWDYAQLVGETFGRDDCDVVHGAAEVVGKRLAKLKALPMSKLDAFLAQAPRKDEIDLPRAQAFMGYFVQIEAGNDPLGLLRRVDVPDAIRRELDGPSKNDRLEHEGWTQLDTLLYRIDNLVSKSVGEKLGLERCVCKWASQNEWPNAPESDWWMCDAEDAVRRLILDLDIATVKKVPDTDLAFVLANQSVRMFLHRLNECQSSWGRRFPKLSEQIRALAEYPAKVFE